MRRTTNTIEIGRRQDRSKTMQATREPLLTYEAYLSEGEINRRYDILDGARVFMTNPTEEHQDIVFQVATALHQYQRRTRTGKMIMAPCDVLITRVPLRTRQPDVLFISNARRSVNRAPGDPAPLDPAPELVVEILSPSDTQRVLQEKLNDYALVNVKECWVVHQGSERVEVLEGTPGGFVARASYRKGDTVQSLTFPDLSVVVADIFTP
jgi:Uma2 family endonuclease